MTSNELETTVTTMLNSESTAVELTAGINRLMDDSTSENIPRLFELTSHENTFLAEWAASALCNIAGISALARALETSDRCKADNLDCDGLNHAILELIWSEPEASFEILKPLILQRDYPSRLGAIWAVSFIDREESRSLLTDIINDPTEDKMIRKEAAYYYDGR